MWWWLRLTCFATVVLVACSGPRLPAPNSTDVLCDGGSRAVQVMVSSLQPPSTASLVAPDGARYRATGISIISQPHVLYSPPPSVGFGVGGFGLSGCCSGFGSGVGLGFPVGRPTPSEVSDQYVASVLIPVPADYAANWSGYHVEVSVGGQSLALPAPRPAG
jgi:hypothetical protein